MVSGNPGDRGKRAQQRDERINEGFGGPPDGHHDTEWHGDEAGEGEAGEHASGGDQDGLPKFAGGDEVVGLGEDLAGRRQEQRRNCASGRGEVPDEQEGGDGGQADQETTGCRWQSPPPLALGLLRSPSPQGEGEIWRVRPHCCGMRLVFSHFATSGTLGIFLLSYSHCARYCICAVCSFMCSCQSLVP